MTGTLEVEPDKVEINENLTPEIQIPAGDFSWEVWPATSDIGTGVSGPDMAKL